MNEPAMDNLVKRLDLMEHQNRRLKRVGALVAVGIAAVVLMGQTRPSKVAKVIEAERFVLRDANGKARAVLSIRKFDGIPGVGLVLKDKNGKEKLVLATGDKSGTGIVMLDEDKNPRLQMHLSPVQDFPGLGVLDEEPTLILLNSGGKGLGKVGGINLSSSSLILFNKKGKGKVIWSAP